MSDCSPDIVEAKRLIRGLLSYADGHELRGKYADELSRLTTDANNFLKRPGVAQTIGWQPIETFDHALAFKGVLVVDRGHVGEAYYDGESDSWWLANTSEHDFDACHAIYPTHWMPLPAGPTPLSSTHRGKK